MTPQRCPHPNTQNLWMAIRLWIWDGEVSLSCQVGGPILIISILKSENLFQLRSGKIWLRNSGQRDEPCWLWRQRKESLSRVRQETCRNWKKHRCGFSPEPPERRSRRYHQCLSFSPGRCVSNFWPMELSNNTSELVKATECVVICYSNNRKLTQLMMIPYGNPETFPKRIQWLNRMPVTQKDPEAGSMCPISGNFLPEPLLTARDLQGWQTAKLRPQPLCVLWIQWSLWPEIWGGLLIPSYHCLGPHNLADELLTQLSTWLCRLCTLL